MNHKNLQKEIKPQTPNIPQPKMKINDPEGLGKTFPIENIGSIAGTIGAAALTGGASAAGEALLMGGTAGLMGAGESILGTTIGSGVAAGASAALGNSTTGHIISGIAGGIAGRAAGRQIANRLRNRNTTRPPGHGQRLGGSGSGRSRLTPEIQETHDTSTNERTQWTIPPEEAMSSIRRAANRTMKRVANTVSNLKDQISDTGERIMGTIRRRGRPRSSVFPKSDDNIIEEAEGGMRWQEEMRQNEQNRNAANRLTAAFKRNAHKNEQLEKRDATNRLKAAFKRKKEENTIAFNKITNENDQLMDAKNQALMDAKNQAASTIKAYVKRNENKNGVEAIKSLLSKKTAARKIGAVMKRKAMQQENINKADKINKGKKIVERMKQGQYNTYLQDEAASNFGAL
jgi:hypothetical protein